ncbi:MAG: haloacid dehalogenase type II [Gammaproteobacteria bacterium]|nr:haloacid dehalogenase type II [Gammaproteobacteria bacterium]
MNNSAFSNIEACVFDAYGTLFDVHSAVDKYREQIGEQADDVSNLWRTKQLQYTWLRSMMKKHVDFWQVTGQALDFALETYSSDDPNLRQSLMDAYLQLDCYPEVHDILIKLKDNGMKLAILSNGAPNMLQAAVDNSGIGKYLDANISVEDVGIFKPDPSVYQLAVDQLDVSAERVSFQSSNSWDAVGAASFGFRVAWVNRFGQRRERLDSEPHAELKTLSELPPLLGF